ncbi:hypothetical protein BMS3Abin16_01697 [archaeon BMS3Abin16]|nr:hypothetical protein BMS3Abin16_01697 [archaeon BMS3Abin16]HDY74588.1 hypothetical protein [Euryarchaeota archaeon]
MDVNLPLDEGAQEQSGKCGKQLGGKTVQTTRPKDTKGENSVCQDQYDDACKTKIDTCEQASEDPAAATSARMLHIMHKGI